VATEKAVFQVPKMYADHHVLVVRNALLALKGVEEVIASSAFRRVVVHFDPKQLTPKQIGTALDGAGYGPDQQWELPETLEGKDDASLWFRGGPRITQTNIKDLEMSGDFRKY
jgi:copper chaperone CopZ